MAAADLYPHLSPSETPKPLRECSIGVAIFLILNADVLKLAAAAIG